MRDPKYDCLFEPIEIGPVVAKNRFYQVPHCNGMGWLRPKRHAAMRGVKAEGGWGVVCTEYCSVHPTSDDGGYPHGRLWNDEHIADYRLMTDAVHEHDGLAGVELWLGGNYVANQDTRIPTFGLRSTPTTNTDVFYQGQSRRLDLEDIADIRDWHAAAARRAVEAGFDIVYVYANHGYLLSEFLDPTTNDRRDEYGGPLENRVRIVRELIEVTREAIADKAGLAVRFSVDLGDPESYDAFGMLSDLPDLWDLSVHDYQVEMGASRFVKEAALQDNVRKAKEMTVKPVAAVGRFTSPDTMARVVRDGTQDMIGAARPSIADPFLPRKIEEGRIEDIRECIGCNICYAHNTLGVPIRCTQNPTMGEEWRKGWHPERIAKPRKNTRVLVIGAGPAGLEAARVLGEQGHEVLLAEASRELGGRVTKESRLPGLSEWARVRDWRLLQIEKHRSIEVFRESEMGVDDVLAVEPDKVVLATGSHWAIDGLGRHRYTPMGMAKGAPIVSADRVLEGAATPPGHVLIFDDDHYYLAPLLAQVLRARGNEVTILTPAGRIGEYARYTQEMDPVNAALIEAGVQSITNRILESVSVGEAVSRCVFTGNEQIHAVDWVLPVTRRIPNDSLFDALLLDGTYTRDTVIRAGDCEAPGLIAANVYSGYSAALKIGGDQNP